MRGTVVVMFLLILFVFGGLLVAVTPVDLAWTRWLAEHRHDGFTDAMRRTLFEGHLPGASDLPVLLILGMTVAYVLAQRPGASRRLAAWRPALGFQVTAALAAGLGVVHSLKWVMGRPRPWSVFGRGELPYSEWYQFGAHYITDGIYRGSFPSGHAAATFMFMVLAYALAGDRRAPLRQRLAGMGVGLFALLLAGAMVVANAMSRSHWLSDGVAVVGLVWLTLHALYYWVLRVPAQQRRLPTWGRPGKLPVGRAYWELRWCGWGALLLTGIVLLALALRGPWFAAPWWMLALLVGLGAALVVWSFPRFAVEYRKFQRHLGSP